MFTTVTVNHLRLSGVVYAEALKRVGALNGMNKVLRIHVCTLNIICPIYKC